MASALTRIAAALIVIFTMSNPSTALAQEEGIDANSPTVPAAPVSAPACRLNNTFPLFSPRLNKNVADLVNAIDPASPRTPFVGIWQNQDGSSRLFVLPTDAMAPALSGDVIHYVTVATEDGQKGFHQSSVEDGKLMWNENTGKATAVVISEEKLALTLPDKEAVELTRCGN